MFNGLAARLVARAAGFILPVFQRISEPVRIISPVCQQPLCLRQAAQQGRRTRVVADLACGHEKADRAALDIGDCMWLDVHAALCPADQTAQLGV